MASAIFQVGWEVAADERFSRIVRKGVATAAPELGHSVHVELGGLQPSTRYWYRFAIDGHISPVGTVRSAPLSMGSPPHSPTKMPATRR